MDFVSASGSLDYTVFPVLNISKIMMFLLTMLFLTMLFLTNSLQLLVTPNVLNWNTSAVVKKRIRLISLQMLKQLTVLLENFNSLQTNES